MLRRDDKVIGVASAADIVSAAEVVSSADMVSASKVARVTIVTCYYKVPSKHSGGEYETWIGNFANYMSGKAIVLFTDRQSAVVLSKYLDLSSIYVIYKDLADFEIVKRYHDKWQVQESLDKENRTKYCYMIWNCKMSMVAEAIQRNPYSSDKFVWNDIGNIRKPKLPFSLASYPDYNKISDHKLDIVCTSNRLHISRLQHKYRRRTSVGGNAVSSNIVSNYNNVSALPAEMPVHCYSNSILAASRQVWLQVIPKYYAVLDYYISRDKFAGCDEQLMTCCILQYPNLFNVILPIKPVYDLWFYMYEYHCYPHRRRTNPIIMLPHLRYLFHRFIVGPVNGTLLNIYDPAG